jgi:hypothetical protein
MQGTARRGGHFDRDTSSFGGAPAAVTSTSIASPDTIGCGSASKPS